MTSTSAARIGELLRQKLEQDPHFYVFSPDETTSNRIDATFQATQRAWCLPQEDWDLPESPRGRLIEMLSENVLCSTMLGHLLNGEQAALVSYEAFLPIMTAQLLQQIKFYAQSAGVTWRPAYPATNLFSTSTCWRQDHNGFTHQSPALISTLLNLPSRRVNCFFPADDQAAAAAFEHMFTTTNVVNLTTFNKTPEPRWLTAEQAQRQLQDHGASIFDCANDLDPQFIFTAAGDIMTREALAAIRILKHDLPHLRLRFVNLAVLSYNAIGTSTDPLPAATFRTLFGQSQPIIANFHGYPETLRTILSHYTYPDRLIVHGFSDRGTTTTPFEMLSLNQTSRYHLCIDVALRLNQYQLIDHYQSLLDRNTQYAREHGTDEIEL